jgi:hypothetical protein
MIRYSVSAAKVNVLEAVKLLSDSKEVFNCLEERFGIKIL